ncbi:organic cation/carnitine transporter 3, partial [Prunus dulcis]
LSLLSPVSPLSLLPFEFGSDLRAFRPLPRPPHLGRSPDRSQMNHDTTANNPRPSAAAAVAGVGRKKPWKPTVRHELPAARSPPFLNQISRVRYQEPDRILKGDLRGIEVARTICRRSTRDPPPANHSFCAKGRFAEFSAKV